VSIRKADHAKGLDQSPAECAGPDEIKDKISARQTPYNYLRLIGCGWSSATLGRKLISAQQ
jgi:hypothetical protein